VASATAVLLLIGVGATMALYPLGGFTSVGRCALCVVLGYSVMSGIAFLLASAHSLTSGLFIAVLVVTGIALWIVALWRNRSRFSFRPLLESVRDNPLPLLVGAGVIVAIAVVRLGYSPLQNLWATTSFRYWGDGVEMADAGRVPVASLQWGALYAPTVSKVMLNSFIAGMVFVLRSQPLPSMGALTWISATGLSLSLWWLSLELGLRRTGPLLVLLLCANTFIGNHELTSDLKFFRAETFGRMVAFSALALAIRAVRDRGGYLDALVAGALFGVSLATHLVPSAVALGMLAWYCLFVAVRERAILQVGRALASSVVIALVIAGVIFFLSGGNLAFGGSKGGGTYQPVGGADPTALFTTGRAKPLGSSAGHWYNPPRTVLEGYVHALLKGYAPDSSARINPYLILLVLLAIGILIIWTCPPRLKPAAVVAVGCGVNLVIVTLAFAYLYNVYILATFGARRLADYVVLPVLILLLVLLEWLASASWLRRGLGDVIVGIVVIAAAVALLANLTPDSAPLQKVAANTIAYLDWIKANTPCNARILSNRRTGGTFEVLAERAAISEGMGPHLRPQMLDHIVKLLKRTRRFFQHPGQGRPFLRSEGIDYIVVYRHKPVDLNLRTFIADLHGFSVQPYLGRVFKNRQVVIYKVLGLGSKHSFPLSTHYPGYGCGFAPIQTAGL
jgi:hypothetical protein